MGLAWDSSPVASQHSYGGLTSGLPVSSLLWLGSESYFICSELWSAIQTVPKCKNPQTLLVILALARRQVNDWNQPKVHLLLCKTTKKIRGFAGWFLRLDATPDGLNYTQFFNLSTKFLPYLASDVLTEES